MTTPQQRLREVRDEASALAAKGVDFTEDDSASFENLIAEGNALKAQIDQLGRFGELKDWMDSSAGTLPVAATTPAGETVIQTSPGANGSTAVKMLEQYGPGITSNKAFMATTTTEYNDAFKTYLRFGERGLNHNHIKTLQEGQDTEGGFLVTPEFLNMIIQKTPTPTRVAGRVTQLNTSRDTLVIPRVNYTSASDDSNGIIYSTGIRSSWVGEIPASATTARVTDPVYGQSRVPIFTNMMSVPLTVDMVEDATFDVMGWLAAKFGETMQLEKDRSILKGTGRGQPTGILNAPNADATQPATVGLADPIGADGIISLGFALPEQYDTDAVFVFSKTQTGPVIAKLKDSDGRYLWGAGLQDSGLSPDIHDRRLLGYSCIMSEFMPAPATNAYPVLFGDLSGYFAVNRVGLSVRVLNELYAETNQLVVLGRTRFGGQVAESWKLRIGQQAA